jgi:hypothetical protein
MKKKVQVKMLPTDEAPNLGELCMSPRYDKPLIFGEFENSYQDECERMNLYFLSDEEIKEGDWYYEESDDKIWQLDKPYLPTGSNAKKIVATTDQKLIKDGVAEVKTSLNYTLKEVV